MLQKIEIAGVPIILCGPGTKDQRSVFASQLQGLDEDLVVLMLPNLIGNDKIRLIKAIFTFELIPISNCSNALNVSHEGQYKGPCFRLGIKAEKILPGILTTEKNTLGTSRNIPERQIPKRPFSGREKLRHSLVLQIRNPAKSRDRRYSAERYGMGEYINGVTVQFFFQSRIPAQKKPVKSMAKPRLRITTTRMVRNDLATFQDSGGPIRAKQDNLNIPFRQKKECFGKIEEVVLTTCPCGSIR